ncbi:MAG: hypothetical protein JWR09_2726 [Mucilaginibacter sp.]|nr:hypothetical protein [Mucilaginibacter sp.]
MLIIRLHYFDTIGCSFSCKCQDGIRFGKKHTNAQIENLFYLNSIISGQWSL